MTAIEVDTTRLPLLLHDLRLPAIARLWPDFAERADKEGWPAARLLSVLAELEGAERGRRRVERPLIEARLPAGKTSTTSTSRRADAQQGTRGRRPEPHPDQGAAFKRRGSAIGVTGIALGDQGATQSEGTALTFPPRRVAP